MFGRKSVLFGASGGRTMNFRKIVALCLVPVLIISAFSAAAEGVEELPGIQMIIENFMAHLLPMNDMAAHSVATKTESIEVETLGILIDENRNTVSLTSEVNSISFFLSDPSRQDAFAGWLYYNLCLYEDKELRPQFQIHRKDPEGKVTDVSSGYRKYLMAYLDAYDVSPSFSMTPRNDKWTHLYEGTVDMLIAWEVLFGYIEDCECVDTEVYPEGITYLKLGGKEYLIVEDGEKALIISLFSEERMLALGFGILYALHANYGLGELSYYYGVQVDDDTVNMEELSIDIKYGILDAILEAASFEDGNLKLQLMDEEDAGV